MQFAAVPRRVASATLVRMEKLQQEIDQRQQRETARLTSLPKSFPLIRVYLLASVVLVFGAFAILSFSTQRIQSGTAINSLRQEAESDVERVVFDVSLAITSYVSPGDGLAESLQANKSRFDRDVINALSGHPISRVDILTPSGLIAYSTDPDARIPISPDETSRVFNGEVISSYHEEFSLTLFNGEPADIATVITANPVNAEWSVEGGPVAVLVAFRDVTDAVPSVTGLIAFERIAVLGGTMAALFVLLSYIVIRGHRFTTAAREKLAGMLETEREMRTQLDTRNSELEEANKAKSQFLTMVSHELKTPLTAITAFTHSLGRSLGQSLTPRQEKQFEALSRNGTLLKLLIDELLDVSAASSGKLKLQFEEITPDSVVQRAAELVQPSIHEKQQHLRISMEDPKRTFTGDPDRLQQVLANLLSNASKYSGERSVIAVAVTSSDEKVCFKISDNGIGISKQDQEKLFSTFFRTDEAIRSGAPGTGLGLVIVRSIVEGHGGTVRIESRLGSGTSAMVELPMELPALPALDAEEASEEPAEEAA